jgi:hypothetical protein
MAGDLPAFFRAFPWLPWTNFLRDIPAIVVVAQFVLPSGRVLFATSAPMLRRGALLFPMLVLLAGVSLVRETSVGLLVSSEEDWAGLLQRQLPPALPAPVTLVEISDETTLKHVWPWGASDFAVFFHAAVQFKPTVLAVEPELTDRGALAGVPREESTDKMLHTGILSAPNLVLGGSLGFAPDGDVAPALQPMPVLSKVHGDLSLLPAFTAVETWAEERFRLSSVPGWKNVPENDLGPRGYCPLIFRYQGQPVPTMTLQLAMLAERVTIDEVEAVLGSHITIGKHRVPIDASGRMLVNFGAQFDRRTYDELLLVREQLDKGEIPSFPAALFQKRMLILGRTDSFVRNLQAPSGSKLAPVELFATALATIHADAYPHRVGRWFDWTLIGVVAFLSLWIPRSKPTRLTLLVVLGEVAVLGAAFYCYQSRLLVLPGVLPVGLAAWILLLRLVAKKAQRVIAF